MSPTLSRCLTATALVVLAAVVGCYETPFKLGDVAAAKVDKALLGTWSFKQMGHEGKEGATLVVADRDGKQYDIAWTPIKPEGPRDTLKMVGFATEVKGVKFMHAGSIEADDKPAEKHLLIRYDLDGDKLVISQLDAAFFDEQQIDSDAKLRAVVEANLQNAAMYQADVMLGERVK